MYFDTHDNNLHTHKQTLTEAHMQDTHTHWLEGREHTQSN